MEFLSLIKLAMLRWLFIPILLLKEIYFVWTLTGIRNANTI